jgi:hypothetical protein
MKDNSRGINELLRKIADCRRCLESPGKVPAYKLERLGKRNDSGKEYRQMSVYPENG